ncbi:hypothetical protein KCU61_g3037, partial [Aureobasidium melanogenum]
MRESPKRLQAVQSHRDRGDAKNVAGEALFIVSIVPGSTHIKDVYLNDAKGFISTKELAGEEQDCRRLYMECSTINMTTTKHIGEALKDADMGTYVDCLVSGGISAADRGDLAFLLGAVNGKTKGLKGVVDQAVASRLRTITLYMAAEEKLVYCGRLGNGLAAKIFNDYLSCTNFLAVSEAITMVFKLSLDKHLLFNVIHSSIGQSFMLDSVYPVAGVVEHAPSCHNYRPGFRLQILVKDVELSLDAAHSVGVKRSIGEAAMKVYRQVALKKRSIFAPQEATFSLFESMLECLNKTPSGPVADMHPEAATKADLDAFVAKLTEAVSLQPRVSPTASMTHSYMTALINTPPQSYSQSALPRMIATSAAQSCLGNPER